MPESTGIQTSVEGWTEQTILAHLVAVISEADHRYSEHFQEMDTNITKALQAEEKLRTEITLRLEQRFIAQEQAIASAVAANEAMRHELQTRHEQRFEAQERAVEVALATVNKEFHEHLLQYQQETKFAQIAAEKAIAAALAATEKAIDKQEQATERAIEKQEVATEKRFEAVNEFRSQLADQASTFARRNEVEQSIKALGDKAEVAANANAAAIAAMDRRTSDSFAAMGSRLDILKGNGQGAAALWAYLAGAILLVIAIASFVLSR